MKKILFSILFAAVSSSALAANVFVGPTSAGNQSGTDWTNRAAWGSVSFIRGNTYYLMDGAYDGKNLSAASGSGTVTIKKATPQDFGGGTLPAGVTVSGQAAFDSQISFNSSNWVFDGQTGGGPGNWTSGFGFKITEPGNGTPVILIGQNSTADNITVRHVELVGKGSATTASGGGSSYNNGVAIYGDRNIVLSYLCSREVGSSHLFANTSNTIIEYCYLGKYYGDGSSHSEAAALYQVSGTGSVPIGDITFRFCVFTHIASTGGLMWDNNSNPSSHLFVYGNIFYKASGASWENANGLIGGWTGGNGEEMHNVWVYNNSFVGVNQLIFATLPQVRSGCEARNNLFYNCQSPDFSDFPGHDHNHFINSGGAHSEANGTSATSGDPFNNFAALDFSLKSNTTPGDSTLPAQYRTDMFGNVGTTRGAVQFGGTPPPPTPTPTPTPPPAANHPGDGDQNMHMTLNEATQYGFCWKSAPTVPTGCPSGADLNNATRAGLLYGSTADGVYHFDSTKTPPACWAPGP